MTRMLALVLTLIVCGTPLHAESPTKSLEIYYIDTEGGQATLFVAPSGQTVLVDTGNEGTRDPLRIMEVIRAAGVKQIDYLLITHYHADHIGGFLELSKLIPILHYVDHGPTVQPEQNSASKQAYDSAIARGPHIVPQPGDHLPIPGIDWTIVSSAGRTLGTNLSHAPGAGAANPYCARLVPKDIKVDLENAQSVGSVIQYGRFRTVDLGDLLWNWEARLVCPVNHLGTVDLLLTTHHGLAWSNVPQLIWALSPRVVIMNNGTQKGGAIESFETIESSPGVEDLWQLHWSVNGLLEYNTPGRFIANIETPATAASLIASPPPPLVLPFRPDAPRPPPIGNSEHSPAYWIKVSAQTDGSFTVTNTRNGFSKTYSSRHSND